MNIYHASLGQPLPPLAPEDEVKPYAHYYYLGPVKPQSPMYEKTRPGNPMGPQYALLPEQVEKIFQGNVSDTDLGYCITPEGYGYASVVTQMPKVTLPMVLWFDGKWNLEDPLRYSIWFPGSHIIQDWDWIVEDMGFGLCEIFAKNFLGPDSWLVDPSLLKPESGCRMVGGSNALLRPLNGDKLVPPFNVVVMHYVRAKGEGLEWHSRFWIGVEVIGGKAVNRLRPGQVVPLEYARGFCEHCAYEMATRAERLPEWYALFKDE